MQLYHRDYGGKGNPPLILLHGLLGSSRNWITVARLLAERFHVFAIDLRNHGQSEHADKMSYNLMVNDVLKWLEIQSITKVHIAGHSMGGKVAMLFSCRYPQYVNSLTIADIAPKNYAPHFQIAFHAMHQIVPQEYSRIAEVEQALATFIDDSELRQFLVTNLKRNDQGTFDWQIHLDGITEALLDLASNPLEDNMLFNGKTKLLHGELSDFVQPEDKQTVLQHFPKCELVQVPDSGHNVHVENRHFFSEQMLKMLSS